VSEASSFSTRSMGSPLRLQVTGSTMPGVAPADGLWAQAVDEFRVVDAELSCYRSDSLLSRLNGSAGSDTWVVASDRLYGFLALADRARRQTRGRFDPRVLPALVRLGHPGLIAPAGRPSTGESDGPGSRTTWLFRDPRRRRVRLRSAVDSGGLGKGLALRWAGRRLAPQLAGRGALLEAGGDIAAWSSAPDGHPWQVGVEDPGGTDEPLAVVSLGGGAISTSSIARQHWVAPDGRPAHHLIDPLTGEPGGDGLAAVTVATSDPAWAEVWSKALFLEGARRIGDEARRRGLAAWWVEADGTLRMTPSARLRTIWSAR
jgi:thiamine biosynthesis lipoprotein